MSLRFLRLLFVAALVLAAALVFATTASLPETVASHFGGSGRANAFMSKSGYQCWMLIFAVGFPIAMVVMISLLPRRFPRYVNIPNREYWLVAERREETLDSLSRYALVLGCLLVLLICSVHALVVQANAQNPPQLANGSFVVTLLIFFAAMGCWTFALLRRFGRIPG